MSVLSDGEIIEALEEGRIVIDPSLAGMCVGGAGVYAKASAMQPCTVDLHLGPRIGRLIPGRIDRYGPAAIGPQAVYTDYTPDEPVMLAPLTFMLCATAETITLKDPRLVAVLCGKSTLARDGLQVEAAGLADPGWSGNLTLEVFNMGPATVVLRPGQPICQIYFVRMEKPALRLYGHHDLGSHYQGATSAQAGFDPVGPARPREVRSPRPGPKAPRR